MADASLTSLVDAALRGTLLALLLLLAWVLQRVRPRLPALAAGLALALGLCVQVISSAPWFEAEVPREWQAPWVAVSVGNTVLFWVFVQTLFDDAFRLRPVHVVAWCVVALVSAVNCAVLAGSASVLAPWSIAVQRAAPLMFAMLAAFAAARHWRADLVEPRRRLRAFIVAAGVIDTVVILATRLQASHGRLSAPTATIDVLLLLVIVGVVAGRMLRFTGSELLPPAPRAVPAFLPPVPVPMPAPALVPVLEPALEPDPAEERLAAALQLLMTEQRAYRDDDLSVASLAARLAVPEYRLRRLINQRLGHRNFNAFVNGFRLDEARAVLADPARRTLPVLTIALDAGFQSIGPFNRAFKEATGMTPTEYRRTSLQEKLADS